MPVAMAAAAAPVPVALRADVDMDGIGVAIGADAAAAGQAAGVIRQLPFADAWHLHVGGGTEHVERIQGAMRRRIMDRAAIARRHDQLVAEMLLDLLENGNEARLQASGIDSLPLQQQTVRIEPGEAAGGSDPDGFVVVVLHDVDIAVVARSRFAGDLKKRRRTADAGKRIIASRWQAGGARRRQ